MAKKKKVKKDKDKKAKKGKTPSSEKVHSEEAVSLINKFTKALNGTADVVGIKGRDNNFRIYIKGEGPENGSTRGESRLSWIGEVRPHRGRVNIGLNAEVDKKGKLLDTQMNSNFPEDILKSYELTDVSTAVKAVKTVASGLEDLYPADEDDDE